MQWSRISVPFDDVVARREPDELSVIVVKGATWQGIIDDFLVV